MIKVYSQSPRKVSITFVVSEDKPLDMKRQDKRKGTLSKSNFQNFTSLSFQKWASYQLQN